MLKCPVLVPSDCLKEALLSPDDLFFCSILCGFHLNSTPDPSLVPEPGSWPRAAVRPPGYSWPPNSASPLRPGYRPRSETSQGKTESRQKVSLLRRSCLAGETLRHRPLNAMFERASCRAWLFTFRKCWAETKSKLPASLIKSGSRRSTCVYSH